MSEKVKIKYRTDKKRCNPEYTEYLEDKKFQLGEHEFTPHRNKNDNTIPVDDMQYEMVRFAIAYIQDKDTIQENACYVNKSHDNNYWVKEYRQKAAKSNACHDICRKFGLKNICQCLTLNWYGNFKYVQEELKEVQNAVRNGDYDVLLKEFPVATTKVELEKITKAVNGYNNVVAEKSEISNKLIEILKKLDEKIDENKILQEQKIKLEDIKQKQADIFRQRKAKYSRIKNIASSYSWFVFLTIIIIITRRTGFLSTTNPNIDLHSILSLLPLTLPFFTVFYILRRTVYRNEILEIEYEHKEVHAEFYTSLLANDINKDDEEIKQFHRNVYLETLNHNPVENVMKKHKNDDEQTTKLLDKIIEILKTK